jgi:hypothetical protein
MAVWCAQQAPRSLLEQQETAFRSLDSMFDFQKQAAMMALAWRLSANLLAR